MFSLNDFNWATVDTKDMVYFRHASRWARTRMGRVCLTISALAAAATLISCATVSRTVVAPPQIAGATMVGSATCSECHQEIARDFKTADHARLIAKGENASAMGCESCHGGGSLHNQSGGAAHTIINPAKSPETCFQCHLEMRGRFNLPHHHPVVEGKLSCSDCHNPHKGRAVKAGGTSLLSENETCLNCHPSQRGPFVYEHEASREGCLTCHNPHGSVNAKLLNQRNATLCLKCHFQQQVTAGKILIGGRDHAASLSRGTCWSAGCHEAVHGSRVSSSLRY